MKLKEIPFNTVVHTPTEAEAKELLAILHENGYEWCGGCSLIEFSEWEHHEVATCYYISSYVEYGTIHEYNEDKTKPLTLADFKRLYCKKEKPQLKDIDHAIVCNGFNKDGIKDGDKVFVLRWDSKNFMAILNSVIGTIIPEKNLEPYTKPETKPTEDMETKELNLCELIGDRDGIHVYSPTCGEVTLQAWDRGKNTKPLIFAQKDTNIVVRTFANGKAYAGGECCIFPSRSLYEQYPLDPYTAWMKWQEEQKSYLLEVKLHTYDASNFQEDFYFRTATDRDKCIEEIKAIIEKYSKKQNQ